MKALLTSLHKDEFAELTTLLHVRYLIFCPSQVLEKKKNEHVGELTLGVND